MEFAHRFDGVTGSAIRDIFKMLAVPGMISFAGGNPSSAALENEVLAEISRDVLLKDGKRILQYGATEGWPALLEEASRYLKEETGVDAGKGELLPTTGSTQAVDLLLKALINEGDVVLVEEPSFLGSLQAMKLYGAKLVTVPMDEDGMKMDALEELAKRHHPKILYTVSTFQNPTGCTLSLEKRRQVAYLAEKYNFIVAEDDPYRGLRYSGEPLPPIYTFDQNARVVYLTSFSKLISPGLRVGAAVTKNPDLMRKLVVGKQSTDCHSANLSQAIVAEYLSRGLMPAHLKETCARYRVQLNTMLQGFDAFPEGVTPIRPEGGLFVWAFLPEGMDARKILTKAVENKVAFVPGTFFYADGGHDNTLRLNFSNSEPEMIVKGMDILSKVMKEA